MSMDIKALEQLPAETAAGTELISCKFTWTGTTRDTLCDPNVTTF